MANKDKKIKVFNRSEGAVGYKIDALRVTRHWVKTGDYLNISIGELLELKTIPGGTSVLENCLLIEDKEALSIIFSEKEMDPEYSYKEDEIKFLLYEGSVEQLLDTLDFAPQGVLDLIKSYSVAKLPNETAKIRAINEKFKIDLNKVHELHEYKDVQSKEDAPQKRRRTAPLVEEKEEKEEVKSTIPKYNVISKED